jgi:hypothetical protein
MLTMFVMEKTFYKLTMCLFADTKREEASVTVTYDRYIRQTADIPFRDVATPELAEAWFSKLVNERGNVVEYMEWRCRTEPREQTAA